MDNSLVFNSTYKSLAAEWLGLSSNQVSKSEGSVNKAEKDEELDIEEDVVLSQQTHVSKKNKESKGSKHEKKGGEGKKLATSLEVGEKLQKKLTKARKRAHERNKDDSANMKKSVCHESDEESKFDVVKKSRPDKGEKEGKSKALTVQDIKRRLKDQTLSKPAKKRLKRKLRLLEENSGDQAANQGRQPGSNKNQSSDKNRPIVGKSEAKRKRKEIEEFSKSFTDQLSTGAPTVGKKLKKTDTVKTSEVSESESGSDEEVSAKNFTQVKKVPDNVNPSPSRKKKNKKKSLFSDLKESKHKQDKNLAEKKLNTSLNGTNDHVKNESKNSNTTGESKDTSSKKKRKHPKKRSKQKNIKKDHRPDEMRPTYMQGAGMKRVSVKTVTSKTEDKETRQS